MSLLGTQPQSKNYRWLVEAAYTETDECIPWPFSVDNTWGYGRVTIHGKKIQATHVVLELTGRPRPQIEGYHGAVALHTCDNPPCCNPRHLVWGTQQDNITDMRDKNRARSSKKSDLTVQNVRDIRRLHRQGWSLRQLSEEYGVSPVAIGQIARHETWKHVRCIQEVQQPDESGAVRITGCARCT